MEKNKEVALFDLQAAHVGYLQITTNVYKFRLILLLTYFLMSTRIYLSLRRSYGVADESVLLNQRIAFLDLIFQNNVQQAGTRRMLSSPS